MKKKVDQERLHEAFNYAWRQPGEQKRNYSRRYIDHKAFDRQAPDEREYNLEGKEGKQIRTDIDTILDGEQKP